MLAEPGLEHEQCLPEFLDSIEDPDPQQQLLQRPNEPLDHPIALGYPDEAWAGLDAEKRQLPLEGMAHVLRTMVMPQNEASGNALDQWGEVIPDALADQLQRFKAHSGPGSMDAGYIADEVIQGHEYRGRPLQPGVDLSDIGAPHAVRILRDDGAIVDPGAANRAPALGGAPAPSTPEYPSA